VDNHLVRLNIIFRLPTHTNSFLHLYRLIVAAVLVEMVRVFTLSYSCRSNLTIGITQGEVIARLIVHASLSRENVQAAASVTRLSREEALRTLERMMIQS
jgi:hypothetical protein